LKLQGTLLNLNSSVSKYDLCEGEPTIEDKGEQVDDFEVEREERDIDE
jgi:hypothetical protein